MGVGWENAGMVSVFEKLEDRIAPAAFAGMDGGASAEELEAAASATHEYVFDGTFHDLGGNGKSVSVQFTDVDGDVAYVFFNAKVDPQTLLTFEAAGDGYRLAEMDLTSLPAKVTKKLEVTVIADDGGPGDGLVNVGVIDATERDVRSIFVDGALGMIGVGDSNPGSPALRSLEIQTLGSADGVDPVEPMISYVIGKIGSVNIAGDISYATLFIGGGRQGSVQSFSVGGNIVGGSVDASGAVFAEGAIGRFEVGGSFIGGDGKSSGYVAATGAKSVMIHGNIEGGVGESSGVLVIAGKVATLEIGGSLIGGAGNYSGYVGAMGAKSVIIQGNVEGGVGELSGELVIEGKVGTIEVGGVIGGDGVNSGLVEVVAFNSMVVHGNVEGGAGEWSGRVVAAGKVGSFVLEGGVIGGAGEWSGFLMAKSAKFLSLGDGNTAVAAGDAAYAGSVFVDSIARLVLKGDIEGGDYEGSGALFSKGVTNIRLDGDLLGGSGTGTGGVYVEKFVRKLNFIGNATGGSGEMSGSFLCYDGQIAQAYHNGSAIPGTGADSGRIAPVKKIVSSPLLTATAGVTLSVGGGGGNSGGVSSGVVVSSWSGGELTLQIIGMPTNLGYSNFEIKEGQLLFLGDGWELLSA